MDTGHIIINFDYLLEIRLLLFVSPCACVCVYLLLLRSSLSAGYHRIQVTHIHRPLLPVLYALESNYWSSWQPKISMFSVCFWYILFRCCHSYIRFSFLFASNIHGVHIQTAYLFIFRYLLTQQPVQVHSPKWNGNNWRQRNKFSAKTKKEAIYVAGERSSAISLDNALWEIRMMWLAVRCCNNPVKRVNSYRMNCVTKTVSTGNNNSSS